MARAPNHFPPKQLTLSVIEPTRRYLARLVETGLYGNTENEVAKTMMLERIRQLIDEGKIVELAPMKPGQEAND